MLSLFKRYRLSRHSVAHVSPFTFLTVCERIKPMSLVEFEIAQQSLEFASDWLYQQQANPQYSDAGHIILRDDADYRYQEMLARHMAMSSVPVVLANCHELLLEAMPVLSAEEGTLGFIHVGNSFQLKQTLDPQLGSAYHFVLSRYSNTQLFCIGVDAEHEPSHSFEYAEDLGCDWLTADESGFGYRSQLKSQLSHYLDHCNQVVLTVDLASLVPSNGISEHKTLDNQMVIRTITQAVNSGKLKMIQLVGAKDKLIYSRQTKEIIDELCHLAAQVMHVGL
ncbi:arginase [Vibrio tritonius]|uniref:Arginase n=1 Tax=Vibrio tritonius TaxID=1435069 RepID=A0ABS7YNG1_9VIBR|nr:arginase [Vibrio tritonius]MCA2017220.1 arginase [Vibrio tritonius]